MIEEIVQNYLKIFPEEAENLKILKEQLKSNEPLNTRKNLFGHIAGDGIVLSPDRRQVLLIYHKVFDMWQQPGGHWDPEDSDPLEVARREVAEETGLQIFELLEWRRGQPMLPIDIALDNVPDRPEKNEPEHYHHTFAYVFLAKSMDLKHQEEEVGGAKWFSIDFQDWPESSHFPKIIDKLKRYDLV